MSKSLKLFRPTLIRMWGGFALFVICALACANFFLARNFKSSFDWVTHTQEVLQETSRVESLLKDVETGQRGFLLTGQSHFLEPYHVASAEIPKALRDLERLVADNQAQQERLRSLRPLLNERMRLAEESIGIREEEGIEEITEGFDFGKGKNVMDQARDIIDEIKEAEEELLLRRKEAANTSMATQQVFGIGLLVLLGLASGGIVWMRSRVRRMEEIVKVCAWTRQVQYGDEWVPMETYLDKRFGVKTSHGLSEDAAEKMREELGEIPAEN